MRGRDWRKGGSGGKGVGTEEQKLEVSMVRFSGYCRLEVKGSGDWI